MMKRLARETEDRLRYHSALRRVLGRWQAWNDAWRTPADAHAVVRSIHRLCSAARLLSDPAAIQEVQRRIHERLDGMDAGLIDWGQLVPGFGDGRIAKAVILKPYLGQREKGVLYVSFENQWIKLLSARNRSDLAERYDVLLSPSASPHNLINYAFAHLWPAPLYTLISNPGDVDVLPGVSPRFRIVELYASCWVNPAWFAPPPRSERPFDLIMVANFGKVKRHHVLFRALRALPASTRVLLVGQDQDGRTAQTILDEARWYGVADRCTLRSNQSHGQTLEALCQSRASVVLSRREGACVAVTESMFADTPVALLEGAEIGSRVFINEHTGRFLRESHLEVDLAAFLTSADRYAPRAWAEPRLSCFASTAALNTRLREWALADGRAWTRDLAALQWHPDPELVEPSDDLSAERASFRERYGLEIGRPGKRE
jgi:glycosyltransferase involved in cell wall biosynthesis